MKTDRELLELAAKAIGGTLSEGHTQHRTGPTWDDWEWLGPKGISTGPDWKPYPGTTIYPQDNDGDALRLATKLLMHVDADLTCVTIRWAAPLAADCRERVFLNIEVPTYSIGIEAATRLAILRAAAAIGEAMP